LIAKKKLFDPADKLAIADCLNLSFSFVCKGFHRCVIDGGVWAGVIRTPTLI
jgi:hypothetical protein